MKEEKIDHLLSPVPATELPPIHSPSIRRRTAGFPQTVSRNAKVKAEINYLYEYMQRMKFEYVSVQCFELFAPKYKEGQKRDSEDSATFRLGFYQ